MDRQEQQLEEADRVLKKEFGADYPKKTEYLRRGLNIAGDGTAKAISDAGLMGNVGIIRAFMTLREVTSEKMAPRGGGNPTDMTGIMQGGTFDYK
ncbi:hypothetical protein [Treponema endosymbiont of Eucomonympha sp.]|uniref:hypothetical protein n=1 Tax=Treponema endosymbiont of Eucomonympha sp. TaxID=1580831 RepID=UPI00075149AE|nr:hypothetical protein [Treponema endosymbiont of Eucomonympha sp.]